MVMESMSGALMTSGGAMMILRRRGGVPLLDSGGAIIMREGNITRKGGVNSRHPSGAILMVRGAIKTLRVMSGANSMLIKRRMGGVTPLSIGGAIRTTGGAILIR